MREFNLYGWIAYYALLVGGVILGLTGLFGIPLTTMFGEIFGRLLCLVVAGAAGYLGYLLYLDKFKKMV